MGEAILENSIMKKYLGDIIHEKGFEESITATTECRTLCLSLGLPSLMTGGLTKNEIKKVIQTKISEECIKRMQEGSKSKDRLNLTPDETQYLQRLSLSNCRIYFRYRSRCIAMVKMNQKGKKSPEGLTCRFCENILPETQEHL